MHTQRGRNKRSCVSVLALTHWCALGVLSERARVKRGGTPEEIPGLRRGRRRPTKPDRMEAGASSRTTRTTAASALGRADSTQGASLSSTSTSATAADGSSGFTGVRVVCDQHAERESESESAYVGTTRTTVLSIDDYLLVIMNEQMLKSFFSRGDRTATSAPTIELEQYASASASSPSSSSSSIFAILLVLRSYHSISQSVRRKYFELEFGTPFVC